MVVKGTIRLWTPTAEGQQITLDLHTYQDMTEFLAKDLEIEIKEWKANRTKRQNSLLWKVIGDTDKHINGRRSEEGSMTIYKQMLKMAHIMPTPLETLESQKELLETVFRLVEVRERRTSAKGVNTVVFVCYRGSSQMKIDEFSDLIETAFDYAEKAGLNSDKYREEWRMYGEVERYEEI